MPASVQDLAGTSRRSTAAPSSVARTTQPGSSLDRGERKADFLCRVRYSNTLPDIPFEPKFLPCPFVGLDRFVTYKSSSLEKNQKRELLTESDLGVKIDLINPDTYLVDLSAPMDKQDELLLEEEPLGQPNTKRSLQHSKIVPWMRKTEYISSEFNRLGTSSERQETKVGYIMKKRFESENVYRDRASQIDAINKTFEEAAKPVHAHYSKPGVTADASFELLPDFELWKYPFAQVIFDSDPAPLDAKARGNEMMAQALIRGMMDESGEQFVAYFVPTEETLEKRAEDAEQGRCFDPTAEYDYQMTREYNWTVKNKATKGYEQENYFIVLRNGGAFYNELETRVRLNRRRAKDGHSKVANSRLIVRNRDEVEGEIAQQKQRLHSLMHPHDGDEEEDDDEHDQAGADESGDVENAKKHENDSDDHHDEKRSSESDEDSEIEVRTENREEEDDDDDDEDSDDDEDD